MNKHEQIAREISNEIDIIKNKAMMVSIIDIKTCEEAIDFLKMLKNKIKKIEDFRTSIVKPFNDAVKNVNNIFREPREFAEKVENEIKEKILKFRIEQEKIEREKEIKRKNEEAEDLRNQAELEKEFAKIDNDSQLLGDSQKHNLLADSIENKEIDVKLNTIRGDVATLVTRTTFEFEVTNIDEVPRCFLCIDEKKIRNAINKGFRKINGINIFEKKSVCVR
jgi:Rps23 Pro-64 3,4-dihydroxylase Tpa1-like proline 4-hydroxylase